MRYNPAFQTSSTTQAITIFHIKTIQNKLQIFHQSSSEKREKLNKIKSIKSEQEKSNLGYSRESQDSHQKKKNFSFPFLSVYIKQFSAYTKKKLEKKGKGVKFP